MECDIARYIHKHTEPRRSHSPASEPDRALFVHTPTGRARNQAEEEDRNEVNDLDVSVPQQTAIPW